MVFDTPFAGKITLRQENIDEIITKRPVTLLMQDGTVYRDKEVITDEELLELAQVSTYDDMPDFIRENREYARLMGFGLRAAGPDQKERTQSLMKELQEIETSGVPRGMEM